MIARGQGVRGSSLVNLWLKHTHTKINSTEIFTHSTICFRHTPPYAYRLVVRSLQNKDTALLFHALVVPTHLQTTICSSVRLMHLPLFYCVSSECHSITLLCGQKYLVFPVCELLAVCLAVNSGMKAESDLHEEMWCPQSALQAGEKWINFITVAAR